jgi:hypothetical protein
MLDTLGGDFQLRNFKASESKYLLLTTFTKQPNNSFNADASIAILSCCFLAS